MRHVARAIEAEHQFRQLLDHGGLPQPDTVEYRETEVAFFWHEAKAAVVVEFDDASRGESWPAEPSSDRGEG